MEVEWGCPRPGEDSLFASDGERAAARARLAVFKARMTAGERREWEALLTAERVARQVAADREQARTRRAHPVKDTTAG